MISVSDLARELGISAQAVRKKITKQLATELADHVQRDAKNKLLIDAVGASIIRESVEKGKQPDAQLVGNQLPTDERLVQFLQDQLISKDDQIRELLVQNSSLINKIENMQVLLKTEQEKSTQFLTAAVEESGIQKTSFWERLVGRK